MQAQNHLKIDSEVNLAQELGNYGSVGGSADNFFNLDVNARQISLFSLQGGGNKIRTPRWDDCSRVFNRRYTYEKKTKNKYDYGRRQRLMSS